MRNDCIKSREYCKPSGLDSEGLAFMVKKERNHVKKAASICGLDWNEEQEEIMNDLKEGNIQLSDEDSDGGELCDQ